MVDKKRIIHNVDASMRMEGMPLSKEDKARMKDCLDGKISYQKSIEVLVKKHFRKEAV